MDNGRPTRETGLRTLRKARRARQEGAETMDSAGPPPAAEPEPADRDPLS